MALYSVHFIFLRLDFKYNKNLKFKKNFEIKLLLKNLI